MIIKLNRVIKVTNVHIVIMIYLIIDAITRIVLNISLRILLMILIMIYNINILDALVAKGC